MSQRIVEIQSKDDLEKCFPLMKELRPHLSIEEFLSIYHDAHQADQYEIAALEKDGQLLALMGYRVMTDFVRGRHLYIDDLVSTEKIRSKGLGAQLLLHAEQIAQHKNCKILRLCTGIENERGVKFYEKNGWTKRAFAYVKKLT